MGGGWWVGKRQRTCFAKEQLGSFGSTSGFPSIYPRLNCTFQRLHTHASPSPFAMSVAGPADGLNDVYEALENYNWDDDVEFQSGLSAILGSNSTPEQAAELTLRARCFYYARYIMPL